MNQTLYFLLRDITLQMDKTCMYVYIYIHTYVYSITKSFRLKSMLVSDMHVLRISSLCIGWALKIRTEVYHVLS